MHVFFFDKYAMKNNFQNKMQITFFFPFLMAHSNNSNILFIAEHNDMG